MLVLRNLMSPMTFMVGSQLVAMSLVASLVAPIRRKLAKLKLQHRAIISPKAITARALMERLVRTFMTCSGLVVGWPPRCGESGRNLSAYRAGHPLEQSVMIRGKRNGLANTKV